MNEIIIEDKKYISSKQAAEITGYAKDYVGQLCREGRIAARLIGRNWYVLEAAIQDHRFGPESAEPATQPPKSKKEQSPITETWDNPRYAPANEDLLPNMHKRSTTQPEKSLSEDSVPVEEIQNVWKEWFTKVSEPTTQTIDTIIDDAEGEQEGDSAADEPIEQEVAVSVPIRSISRSIPVQDPISEVPPTYAREVKTAVSMTPVFISVSVAAIAVIIAAINTGFLDSKIAAYQPASIITGVSAYKK